MNKTRLEYLRRKKGLTQAELGKRVLYSRWVIAKLEQQAPASATVNIRLRTALERFFEESFNDLMGEACLGAGRNSETH